MTISIIIILNNTLMHDYIQNTFQKIFMNDYIEEFSVGLGIFMERKENVKRYPENASILTKIL